MNDFKLKYLIRSLMCGSHQNDIVTQTHILNKRYKGAHFTLVFFIAS